MNALLLTAMLVGQCPGGICPAPMQYNQPVATYEWRKFNDDSYLLFCGGSQIGLFVPSRNTYWPVNTANQTYGQPTTAPIELPVKVGTPAPKSTGNLWEISGVDKSRVSQAKKYVRESGEVDEPNAFNVLADTIPDDQNHLHVTFIDADVNRARAAMEDFKHKEPALSKTVHTKAYSANDPTVKNAGFVTSGTPTVYIQQGQAVVGRSDTYPGAKELAQAIRKKQPNYNPEKDPPIGGSDVDLNALLSKLGAWLQTPVGLIIAVVVGLLIFARKPESK